MKNLGTVSKAEQELFFKSFDHILCDVDGVLWRNHEAIPGAKSAISSLKTLKKKISYVSNNSTKSQEVFSQDLRKAGYDVEKSDVIQPTLAIISYLKKINFSKEIFLIGMTAMQDALKKAGFAIFEYVPALDLQTPTEYIKHCIVTSDKVGAVIVDFDVNLAQTKLQNAAVFLENPDVLFITAGPDLRLCVEGGREIIGPGVFQKILAEITGRSPLNLAKPSAAYGEFIKEECQIENSERVLFIGDSISEDLGFAAHCNFQKLLVLSGLAKEEDLTNWTFPETYKSEYYVESLKAIQDILNSNEFNTS